MSDLERELEQELHRVLDPISAQPIPARHSPPRHGVVARVVGGAGAAATLKLLSGVAVAAAAVTVAGTAATGSPNPMVWGQQVSSYVSTCKDKLAAGQHGIGDCVSTFANSHGQAVASDARHQGAGNGNGSQNAHGNNPKANDHAKTKSTDHPAPGPTSRGSDPEPVDPAMHPQVTPPAPR